MSDFAFRVTGDATGADRELEDVLGKLDKIEAEARQAGQAITKSFVASEAAARSAAAETRKMAEAQQQLARNASAWADALKGAFAAAGGVAAIKQVAELSDHYTGLYNAALKFADAGHTVNQVLDEQRSLAHDLKAGLDQTMGAYDAVRDATDSMNFTHEEQIRITRTLGEAAQLSGKSMESASEQIYALKVAMETGQEPGRQLRTMFKSFPDLADHMSASLGITTGKMIEMADSGQLSIEQLVGSLGKFTDDIDQKHGQRLKTLAQTWEDLKDTIAQPIDFEKWEAPFGRVSQAAARLADDMAKLTARWRAQEEAMKGSNFVGSYTATRLDTPDQRAADLTRAFAKEQEELRKKIEGARLAYEQGGISLEKYNELIGASSHGAAAAADEYEKMYQAIKGPQQEAASALNVLGNLYMNNRIKLEEYTRAAEKHRDVLIQLGLLKPKPDVTEGKMPKMEDYTKGIDTAAFVPVASIDKAAEWEELTRSWHERLEQSRKDTEAFMAAFSPLGDAMQEAFTKGEVALDSLSQTLRQASFNLFKVLALQASANLMTGGGSGAVLGQVVGGIFGGAHAHGGTLWEGSGGTDSQLYAIRKSPNERVTIETPPQYLGHTAGPRTAYGSGGGPVSVGVFMKNDEREITSAFHGAAGETAIAVHANRKWRSRNR